MTRYARGGTGNKKKPEEATPWRKMKQGLVSQSSAKKQRDRRDRRAAVSQGDGDIGNKQETSLHPGHELTDKELRQVLVKTKRSEERRLKRIRKKNVAKVCYHCRQPGHGMSECPQMTQDVEQGTGICFRCGSTEHKSAKCTTRNIPEQQGKQDLPFAKCFICGETGHLARSCPDNPRGLYPNGGCCKHCGSVEHHQWQCPSNKASAGLDEVQVSTMDSYTSVDLEVIPKPKVKAQPPARKGPKVVKF